jgi:hypothetical protein
MLHYNACSWILLFLLSKLHHPIYPIRDGRQTNAPSWCILWSRYPSDVDKHILARQTGLSRNQVRTPPSSSISSLSSISWSTKSVQINANQFLSNN